MAKQPFDKITLDTVYYNYRNESKCMKLRSNCAAFVMTGKVFMSLVTAKSMPMRRAVSLDLF